MHPFSVHPQAAGRLAASAAWMKAVPAGVTREAVSVARIAAWMTRQRSGPTLLMPAEDVARAPVLLVHGMFVNESYWAPLTAQLLAAGHPVCAFTYVWAGASTAQCGRHVGQVAESVADLAGTDRLHLVGHSLGGVVSKWAVHHTGLGDLLDTAVTLGSPHRGLPFPLAAGRLVPGIRTLVDELTPGHETHRVQGTDLPGRVTWHTVAGGLDVVVPPPASELPSTARASGAAGEHVTFPALGHNALVTAPSVLQHVCRTLAGSTLPVAA